MTSPDKFVPLTKDEIDFCLKDFHELQLEEDYEKCELASMLFLVKYGERIIETARLLYAVKEAFENYRHIQTVRGPEFIARDKLDEALRPFQDGKE